MSVQTALLAPATRVLSRRLGPTAGRLRCSPAPTVRSACATSRLASTCGRCETHASSRSWVSGSIAVGRAPSLLSSPWSRSYSTPAVLSCAGVRYQVAPSKRSSRACSTPEVSEPASGWPPMKRSSAAAAATTRLVEPTSLTTHSGPALSSAARTVSASAPTGAATKATSAPRTASATSAARASIAPSASAFSPTLSSGSYPLTWARARPLAARPIEPPISPTPRIATFKGGARRRGGQQGPAAHPGNASDGLSSHDAERLAREPRRALDRREVLGEAGRVQRLRSVADGLGGVGVRLDDDPVGARGRRGQRERLDELAPARRVAGVHDHRQVRQFLEDRHGHQVERHAAMIGLERADPPLAEHHRGIAFLEDVLGSHQQLIEWRREPALEQRGAPRAPDLRQQRVVLHVARADLDHVGDLEHGVQVADVHQLGDDRHARLGLRLGEQPQALLPQPLEGVGRGARLVGAAAEQGRPRLADDARGLQRDVARFDGAGAGDHGEALTAHLASVDLKHRALAVRDLRRGELVGLEDRHHPVDARLALQPKALDARVLLDVADRADHGDARAAAAMGARARLFDLPDDRVDLLFGRGLLHHDHHQFILSNYAWILFGPTALQGAESCFP